ncbi:MAG: prepilin peptidase [Armatimonadetes bacterium]|nr:prepilin peptidase [Armatimonadota bacterium]
MISWLAAAIGVAALFGLNVGSFLNVVIWRLPRGGSLSDPTWSYCPQCKHRLGALDLAPVLSFLALRARCRYCRSPISWRYPAIEMLTGLLFAAVAWRFAGAEDFSAAADIFFECLFLATLICVFFIDLEHFVIPDGLNVLGLLIGLAHWAVISWWVGRFHPLRSALAGAAGYAAVIYGIGLLAYVVIVGVGAKRGALRAGWNYLRENAADWAWIAVYYLGAMIPPLRRLAEPPPPLEGASAAEIEADEDEGGMGGGDGKLAAAIGANLLFPLWLHSLYYAVLIGVVQGVAALFIKRRRLGERTAIPFGPAMVGGALIALFIGHPLWDWYVRHYWPLTAGPPAPAGLAEKNIKSF